MPKKKAIKIDKRVPLPPPRSSNSEFPLAEMSVGDSFLAPVTATTRVRTYASAFGKRHGRQFITRTQSDGIRVWRTE